MTHSTSFTLVLSNIMMYHRYRDELSRFIFRRYCVWDSEIIVLPFLSFFLFIFFFNLFSNYLNLINWFEFCNWSKFVLNLSNVKGNLTFYTDVYFPFISPFILLNNLSKESFKSCVVLATSSSHTVVWFMKAVNLWRRWSSNRGDWVTRLAFF